MHMTMKETLREYQKLPEDKKEKVWEVMDKHYDALAECAKKEMGYDLAVVVYGDKLAEEEAERIVSEMHGHGKSGMRWTMDDVRSFAASRGVDFAKTHYSLGDLYAVMHAQYYDQHVLLESLTSSSGPMAEYCLKMALGFLDDEDAPDHGKGKARKYFHFVVDM